MRVTPRIIRLKSIPSSVQAAIPATRTVSDAAWPRGFFRSAPKRKPGTRPIAIGRKIITGIICSGTEPPETLRAVMALTVKKTTMPTTSSKTAINYNRRGNPAACSGEERRPPFSHKSSCMIYNCYLFR